MSTGVRNRVKQMMKTRRIKKWLMGITTVALLAMQTVTAFASVESYSQTKLGSITITPGDQDHKGAAVDKDEAGTYTLYRVGDVVDGSSVTEFTLAKDFAGSGVTIDRESLNSAELPKTLAKYAEDHSITALKDDIKSGEEVGELEIGLYLVKQKTVHVAWHSFSPFLVIMPEAVEGGYEYDVKAMPKTWKLSTAKLDPLRLQGFPKRITQHCILVNWGANRNHLIFTIKIKQTTPILMTVFHNRARTPEIHTN